MKVIDIDKLFDSYIADYVYKNIGKVKPEEIENKIPVLYEEFGNATLKELEGKTPSTFYMGVSVEELLDTLKKHIEQGVSVSDFLCEGIIGAEGAEKAIGAELQNDGREEYLAYLMNMLKDIGGKIPVNRYLEFALYDYPESIGELATEFLGEKIKEPEIKEKAINAYKDANEQGKARLTEILSNAEKDDRVFDILIAEFARHTENIPLYANYLARYGDERAIPFLNAMAEEEKITYADYEEITFAIEVLGGECKAKRDFSTDKSYKKIKGAKNIFRGKN